MHSHPFLSESRLSLRFSRQWRIRKLQATPATRLTRPLSRIQGTTPNLRSKSFKFTTGLQAFLSLFAHYSPLNSSSSSTQLNSCGLPGCRRGNWLLVQIAKTAIRRLICVQIGTESDWRTGKMSALEKTLPKPKIELYSGKYFAACALGGVIGEWYLFPAHHI